jgi:hypothetical protein
MELEALVGPLPNGWTVQHLDVLRSAGTGSIGQASGMCIGTHFTKSGSGDSSQYDSDLDPTAPDSERDLYIFFLDPLRDTLRGPLRETDRSSLQHPSLESIENEWQTIVHRQELIYWRNPKTGKFVRRDPRLTAEALRARRVDVQDIILV